MLSERGGGDTSRLSAKIAEEYLYRSFFDMSYLFFDYNDDNFHPLKYNVRVEIGEIELDDLIKNVKAQLYDRVSSPLLFSFAVSWCAWNYRYLLIVISSMSPTDKFLAIDMLDIRFTYSWQYWLCFGFLFPAITSFLYLFVYPFPAKFVYRYVRAEQKKLKDIQTEIDEEMTLTVSEARDLRKQVREMVNEHEVELKEKDVLIAKLKEDLIRATSESTIRGAATPTKAARATNLSPSQEKLLQRVAANSSGAAIAGLLSEDAEERITDEYDIDELIRLKLIINSPTDSRFVRVTAQGRAYLVENVIGERKNGHEARI